MKYAKTLPLLAACALASLSTAKSEEIKDAFKSQLGKSALNERKTEAGRATWEASENLVLADKRGAISVTDGEPFTARVAVDSSKNIIKVEAEVHPTAPEGTASWVAIGLGDELYALDINWGKGLVLMLRTDGDAQAFAGYRNEAPPDSIKTVSAPKFDAGGPNKLRIEYNKELNSASFFVNDVAIVEDYRLGDFTPEASFAGFSGFNQVPQQATVVQFKTN